MCKRMKEFLSRLNRNESGAMSVEKILIIALVALPILLVLLAFRVRIVDWFNGQSSQLQDPGTAATP